MADIPPIKISALMQKYHLKPDKSLGQNFLVDPEALARITEAADLSKKDTVLEIGAGIGHLTRFLAVSAEHVIAVELDPRLIPPLQEVTAPFDNVRVIQGDILQIDPGDLILKEAYVVVANIPYYITSAIIRHLLESQKKPDRMVLTVQEEVAQRICATAGDLSVLALSVLIFGEPYLTGKIPARSFHPPPKVDSAVIRIDLYSQAVLAAPLQRKYFTLIKAGFLHKRKTLRNSLQAGLGWTKSAVDSLLASAHIDPRQRAQSLTLAEWIQLTRQYHQLQAGMSGND